MKKSKEREVWNDWLLSYTFKSLRCNKAQAKGIMLDWWSINSLNPVLWRLGPLGLLREKSLGGNVGLGEASIGTVWRPSMFFPQGRCPERKHKTVFEKKIVRTYIKNPQANKRRKLAKIHVFSSFAVVTLAFLAFLNFCLPFLVKLFGYSLSAAFVNLILHHFSCCLFKVMSFDQ